MAESFPISGNIDPKSFPFLLMDLHRQGATGSLKVEGPTHPKALYYRSGRILFGSSNDPKDQLGAILIENGKITATQLSEVNTKVGPGNPLAKVLAESGFVSQRELGEAARIKVERILSDTIGYTSGTFEFEDGVLPKGAVDLKLATEKLVLAAVRRIADRTFVLRHLEGLDIVLALRSGADLAEAGVEAGGLQSHLNGQRSLKEAARLARLDEFDAAKIACGLLFLGLVVRNDGGNEAAISADPELDLAATAAMAFEDSGSVPPAPTAEPEEDAFFMSVGEPPTLDAGGSTPFPLPDDTNPPAFPMPETDPFTSADASDAPGPGAFLATEPEPDEPKTLPRTPAFGGFSHPPDLGPAPAAEPPEPTGFAVVGAELETTALPVMEPPTLKTVESRPSYSVPSFAAERMAADAGEAGHEPVTASRPSKEDLAALDALLNPATTPRPLEPAKTPSESRSGQWEPQFQSMAKPRRSSRPQLSPVVLIGIAAGVIAVIAGGSWYYLNQVQATPVAKAAVVPPPPSAVAPSPLPTSLASPLSSPSAEAVSPPPIAVPSPAAPATPSPAAPATPSPRATPTPLPVATPAVSPLDNGPVTEARSLMRQGSFGPAAKGFAANVKAATSSPFTIQLLVACSNETVQKAMERVVADELYILPVSYKGKSCNRICWGLYHDEAGADSAVSALPEYFRQNGATPKVVKTTTLLR